MNNGPEQIQMSTIALIDTRLKIPGESIGAGEDNLVATTIWGFLHIPAKRFNPGFRVDSKMTLYHF